MLLLLSSVVFDSCCYISWLKMSIGVSEDAAECMRFHVVFSFDVLKRSKEMHVSVFCFSERENWTYSHPRLHSECSSTPKDPLR